MIKLKLNSEKEKDYSEMVKIVSAVENCTFKDPSDIIISRENIITVAPENNPRLKRPDKKISGWIKSKQAQKVFYTQLDKYQNNQYCYLQRLESGKISSIQVKKNLTELEMWFIQIIEPFPEKKDIKYQEYLKKWFEREQIKYKFSRSYYCEEEVLPYLDMEKLYTIQNNIFENYEKVKNYYNKELDIHSKNLKFQL